MQENNCQFKLTLIWILETQQGRHTGASLAAGVSLVPQSLTLVVSSSLSGITHPLCPSARVEHEENPTEWWPLPQHRGVIGL